MRKKPIEKIEFRNMSFINAKGAAVFNNVNFTLTDKGVFWLKGSSGAGKSVLVKMICGLMHPTAGQYLLNGRPVSDMTFESFLPYRCNMGYSFDFGGLINNRDIVSNLLLACQYHNFKPAGGQELAQVVEDYLKIFGLKDVAAERPSAIVGRLRKAACVARAFIHEPQIILLDDPTTGLRKEMQMRLRDLIMAKIQSGSLQQVFLATEDEEFVQSLEVKVIEIKDQNLFVHDYERSAA